MKKLLPFIFFIVCAEFSFSQVNLQLLGHLPFSTTCAGVWQYVDSIGNEYALVGAGDGIAIVDVTNPAVPDLKFTVPAANSLWRELKTFSHYCYATTEGGGGITIVNLEYLPDSVQTKVYTGDSTIAGLLSSGHTVEITDGYLYVFGSNIGVGGAIILDLNNDPWNPQYAGQYNQNYIHDGFVRNDTLWAGEIYDGWFSVIDVTNKANPVLIATQQTPGSFTHSTWLSDNSQYLFTTDEVNGAPLGSFDVSDLSNIQLMDTYFTDSTPGEEVHNVKVMNDFLVCSDYGSQMTIVDASHPDNLVEIGSYPTGGFLCWDASPYLPSGNIIATDVGGGLYIFAPYYVHACYLEGIVTDSVTTFPVNNVSVKILGAAGQAQTAITGNYKTGLPDAGTYTVEFSKPGYITQTIPNVVLTNGVVTTLNVQLVSFEVTGTVIDAFSGNPIDLADVKIEGTGNTVYTLTDAAGHFTLNGILSGNAIITAGKWSYKSQCASYSIPAGGPITIMLDRGYYDDFAFDFGWAVNGTATDGIWERGEPVGTSGTFVFNPDSDATDDCSDECFVTGNQGTTPVDDDLDNGYTQLTSPVFDLSGYTDPYLNYERWFVDQNTNQSFNDTLFISLNNGTATAVVEMTFNGTTVTSAWISKSFKISDYISPSSTMQMIVFIEDKPNSGSTLECGLDKFEISEGPLDINEEMISENEIAVYPNPFSENLELIIKNAEVLSIEISDLTGREIKEINSAVNKPTDKITLNLSSLQKGVYLLTAKTKDKPFTKKIVKL